MGHSNYCRGIQSHLAPIRVHPGLCLWGIQLSVPMGVEVSRADTEVLMETYQYWSVASWCSEATCFLVVSRQMTGRESCSTVSYSQHNITTHNSNFTSGAWLSWCQHWLVRRLNSRKKIEINFDSNYISQFTKECTQCCVISWLRVLPKTGIIILGGSSENRVLKIKMPYTA